VAWRGVTNGPRPDEVMLAFPKDSNIHPFLVVAARGEQYDSSWKDTVITVGGPTNGWYQFSGVVRVKDGHYDDKTFKVKGSIACASYGAPFG
jgi:hypothetical protein